MIHNARRRPSIERRSKGSPAMGPAEEPKKVVDMPFELIILQCLMPKAASGPEPPMNVISIDLGHALNIHHPIDPCTEKREDPR